MIKLDMDLINGHISHFMKKVDTTLATPEQKEILERLCFIAIVSGDFLSEHEDIDYFYTMANQAEINFQHLSCVISPHSISEILNNMKK